MKLHIEPAAARERLVTAIEALGGRAVAVGRVLELSYPAGQHEAAEQERLELLFFVRAWAASDPTIEAEILT